MRGIAPVLYLVIGLVVAQQHHYVAHLSMLLRVISAVLAIVLWPLVVLHVDLHLV